MGSSSNPPSNSPAPGAPAPAGTATAPATTPVGAKPAELPIALKVNFTLITPDKLREINFGLEKDSDGVKVNWTLTFTLYERTDITKDFTESDKVVSLNVFLATTVHAKAEKAAKGLTPAQAAHVTGPAADAAKAVHEGSMPMPVGNKIITASLN